MKETILVTGGTGFIGSHTTVELQEAGYNVVIDDVLIEESRIMESRDELALKPSPLNEGLHETLHFNESGIKKTRSGDFMVWARLNGVDLPDKEISPEMGIRYLRLTGGAEKEVVLRAALQQSYGAEISQIASRSQSATVKI